MTIVSEYQRANAAGGKRLYPSKSESCESVADESDASDALARQLRVAIISDSAPERNGVGSYYVDLAAQLSTRVQRVEMISPTIRHGAWQAGLVFSLPGDPTQKLCMPNPFSMRRQLNSLRPHLVIIATPGVYGLCGAFLASRMGIPAIAGFHTSFERLTELYWNKSVTGKLVHGYFRVSNSYLFRKCQRVLANSNDMVAQAKRLGGRNVCLITTGISPVFSNFPITPFRGEVKKVLFAGRLAPEKNIQAILDAAEKMPDLHFTLAGDGPLMSQVSQAQSRLSNVHCLGWIDRQCLRQQIDEHDLLVLPSHFESFGTIALEAMARQRLVLVSDDCGIAHWPEFREGLSVFRQGAFFEALTRLCRQSSGARHRQAQKALHMTRALNDKNLQQWCKLMLELVTPET